MHATYKTSLIKELRDQQVRFAPRNKKIEQAERAEKLLGELDPARTYSYEYLCFRITDFRPDSVAKQTMSGDQARHDVRLFVEDVSDAANIRTDELSEPVHTVEELSRLFKVSTKTISRWRDEGLVSRRLIFDGGRKRVGFLQSSVNRFVEKHQDRVSHGERYRQLSRADRDEIVDRARRLARMGANQTEASRRIAKHMNRSTETIRYTLKQFDKKHPHLAVFPANTGTLTDDHKRRIYKDYRGGATIDELTRRFHRNRTSIYRVIHEVRAEKILQLPLDYIHNAEFESADAESRILTPMPEADMTRKPSRTPAGLPRYLASLYEVPLLTREQEYHLFRKFNFLKFLASKLRSELDPTRAKADLMDRIEQLYEEAVKTKNQIIQANLRLVVSIAKRHVSPTADFFSLVSDGNISLMHATEKFDYSRGNKFSTYATWSLMRNFARSIPDEFRYQDRFRTSQDEAFTVQADHRDDLYRQENAQLLRERQIDKILSRLDDREQHIIISRFGLDHSQEPKTLKQVGEEFGVTKERVRQIEARAIDKLRLAAEEERIELAE